MAEQPAGVEGARGDGKAARWWVEVTWKSGAKTISPKEFGTQEHAECEAKLLLAQTNVAGVRVIEAGS